MALTRGSVVGRGACGCVTVVVAGVVVVLYEKCEGVLGDVGKRLAVISKRLMHGERATERISGISDVVVMVVL